MTKETEAIVEYINSNTEYETMDCLSTKKIAEQFGLSTKVAYNALKKLANEKG